MSETVTVKIEINGVVYPVSCMTGEENRLIESSKEVNKVIASLSNVSETIGETRLLAMTSLILADKLIEQENITNKNFFESQEFNASILKYASFNGHDLSNAKFIDIDDLNTISFGKLILNGETTRTRLEGAQFIGTGTLNLQGADLRRFDLNQESLAENRTIRLEQKLIDVNLKAPMFITRTFLPLMNSGMKAEFE